MTNESITNEWTEFLAYTNEPTYAVKNKKYNGFLGYCQVYFANSSLTK